MGAESQREWGKTIVLEGKIYCIYQNCKLDLVVYSAISEFGRMDHGCEF